MLLPKKVVASLIPVEFVVVAKEADLAVCGGAPGFASLRDFSS